MQLHHLCIQTDCYEESVAFYQEVLDMRIVQETENFHGRAYNTWLTGNGVYLELQTAKRGETLRPCDTGAAGIVHMCFYTEELDGFYRRVKELPNIRFREKDGGAIYTVNGGRLLKLVAPEGTVIEIRNTPGC